MGIWLCDRPGHSGFRTPSDRQESFRFKHAQAEIERLVKVEGKQRPRTSIWSIPGAKKRIFIGWLLYVPNACGYWGITVFLTTFMVQKFHVTPVDAIFYAMTFYIVQFFLSYIGTGLSDFIGRRPDRYPRRADHDGLHRGCVQNRRLQHIFSFSVRS